jgi:hypothetical protein
MHPGRERERPPQRLRIRFRFAAIFRDARIWAAT